MPLGAYCEVVAEHGEGITCEVVGFDGEEVQLMPLATVQGLLPGRRGARGNGDGACGRGLRFTGPSR